MVGSLHSIELEMLSLANHSGKSAARKISYYYESHRPRYRGISQPPKKPRAVTSHPEVIVP